VTAVDAPAAGRRGFRCASAQTRAHGTAQTVAMASREVRLLLVDDDPTVIQAMSRMLAQYPDQRFATSGEDALHLAREATPDLILLDSEMPGMTGGAVCMALKADPALASVPVIFVTSQPAAGSQQCRLRAC